MAAQNCDFAYATGTLNFQTGDTFKSFSVLISKDAYIEGPETVNLQLSSPTGGSTLGAQSGSTSVGFKAEFILNRKFPGRLSTSPESVPERCVNCALEIIQESPDFENSAFTL